MPSKFPSKQARHRRRRRFPSVGGGGDFLTGLVLQLKAESITGVTDGNSVETWTDEIGSYAFGTPVDSPTFETNELNTTLPATGYNSPAIERHYFSLGATAGVTDLKVFTLFVILKATATADARRVVECFNSTIGWYVHLDNDVLICRADTSTQRTGTCVVSDAYHIICVQYSNTGLAVKAWKDGGAAFIDNTFTAHTANTGSMLIGSGTSFTQGLIGGRIPEIRLYNSALAIADVNTVGDYLATYYDLTWTTAT